MSRKSIFSKLKIESTQGTLTDLSMHFKSARVYDKDGNEIDYVVSEKYLKELDEKYEKSLADIVAKRK